MLLKIDFPPIETPLGFIKENKLWITLIELDSI